MLTNGEIKGAGNFVNGAEACNNIRVRTARDDTFDGRLRNTPDIIGRKFLQLRAVPHSFSASRTIISRLPLAEKALGQVSEIG